MSEWQPIETAPKDGTKIIVGKTGLTSIGQWINDPGYIREHRDIDGRWNGQDEYDGFEGWMDWEGGIQDWTHWMPLPESPKPPITDEARDTKTIDLFATQAS